MEQGNNNHEVGTQASAAYDHSDCDCFGCAILTHGREGLIYATDRIVPLEALVSPFQRDNCPTLVGKPKLFFIQACRGTKLHRRMDVTDSTSSLDRSSENSEAGMGEIPYRRIPVQADFLFSYSTVPGFYSWRNSQEGSWYIQALCIVMENYGSKMELLHMLTQVNRMVAYDFESCSDEDFTEKEMPSIASMLTRYIFFRPKKPDIRG
ncbi:hypothetical protein CHS0354_039149 [Potamilus streckersoni]|uniref:Caspase-3 n=1 Tax=Potamilus streckersoni TaxID=2493646 RepID=A0AAE0VQX5_9BIVA|nr:hypothetical protein CHS0354_039149 [Potamilus streckersoni]